MATQHETRALESEFSGSDTEKDKIPEATGPQPPKKRRKIIWNRVAEFENEEDTKQYFAHSWKLMRTYMIKVGCCKTCTFYCQPHGKPCLVQWKYISVRGPGRPRKSKAIEALSRDDEPVKRRKQT